METIKVEKIRHGDKVRLADSIEPFVKVTEVFEMPSGGAGAVSNTIRVRCDLGIRFSYRGTLYEREA